VFRHCEGKDSRETIRCTHQAMLNQQVKSALRKFSEGKDHDCDSFMSDVPVLYKSCVSHLVILITLFAEFKCFDYIPPIAKGKG